MSSVPRIRARRGTRASSDSSHIGIGSSRVGSGAPGLRVSNSRAHEGSLSVMLICRWGVCQRVQRAKILGLSKPSLPRTLGILTTDPFREYGNFRLPASPCTMHVRPSSQRLPPPLAPVAVNQEPESERTDQRNLDESRSIAVRQHSGITVRSIVMSQGLETGTPQPDASPTHLQVVRHLSP